MKLASIHESRKLPSHTKVFQKDEHQGAKHPKRWYQKYARKATPYRWPRLVGPKPVGYSEHILD